MKRFLLGLAAVAAIVMGSSLTNSAMAHGPSYGGHGHRHGGYCAPPPPRCGSYGGYSYYRPSYGGYGYGGYGYGGYGGGYPAYGYRNSGVIQLYGPRGGFALGF